MKIAKTILFLECSVRVVVVKTIERESRVLYLYRTAAAAVYGSYTIALGMPISILAARSKSTRSSRRTKLFVSLVFRRVEK